MRWWVIWTHWIRDLIYTVFAVSHTNKFYEYLSDYFVSLKGQTVSILEAGVGTGFGQLQLYPAITNFQYKGIDIDDAYIAGFKRRHTASKLQVEKCDFYNLESLSGYTHLLLIEIIMLLYSDPVSQIKFWDKMRQLHATNPSCTIILVHTVFEDGLWTKIVSKIKPYLHYVTTMYFGQAIIRTHFEQQIKCIYGNDSCPISDKDSKMGMLMNYSIFGDEIRLYVVKRYIDKPLIVQRQIDDNSSIVGHPPIISRTRVNTCKIVKPTAINTSLTTMTDGRILGTIINRRRDNGSTVNCKLKGRQSIPDRRDDTPYVTNRRVVNSPTLIHSSNPSRVHVSDVSIFTNRPNQQTDMTYVPSTSSNHISYENGVNIQVTDSQEPMCHRQRVLSLCTDIDDESYIQVEEPV
jgi:hypothetical protein